MSRTRELDNGLYVLDFGYRKEQPVALVERTLKDNSKEYIIAFNYEIKDNKIDWGYGYYYSENIEKAKTDFKRVLNGENLADTFSNKNNEVIEDSKKEFNIQFYTEEEIKELIKSKAELYYVDDGMEEAIVKVDDIPDFIVDYNRNFEIRDLKFFKVGKDVYEPDITTYGEFLNTINTTLRERIIDRLIALQTNEIKPKKYKIIDENLYSKVEEKLEKEELKKQKNSKNREIR